MPSGEEYFAKAEKEVGKWLFNDYDTAQELFTKAGGSFKADKDWRRAGESFMRAGDLSMKLKNAGDACIAYTESAKCYKKCDLPKAKAAIEMATKLNIENNRLTGAAKLLCEWADSLCEEGKDEEAIQHYRKAADYYAAENQSSSANSCNMKMAKALGALNRFEECASLFEMLGKQQASGPLKHQAKEQFLRATLCRAALVQPDNSTEKVAEARDLLETYLVHDVYLKNTREREVMEGILDALEDQDEEKLDDVIAMMDELKMLDDWKSHIMLVVKNNISSTR